MLSIWHSMKSSLAIPKSSSWVFGCELHSYQVGEEVGKYRGAYKVTQDLMAKYGSDRVVDTPITEYGFTGIGVGASQKGLRPIVEFMTWNFAMQVSLFLFTLIIPGLRSHHQQCRQDLLHVRRQDQVPCGLQRSQRPRFCRRCSTQSMLRLLVRPLSWSQGSGSLLLPGCKGPPQGMRRAPLAISSPPSVTTTPSSFWSTNSSMVSPSP